ncbi:lipopolysaccharide-induced tumor necrosis factor-alpha factor homolog [Drosophila albomicans]|uniref:Lipopolysaccharide-induced tumor necrosis factor-alpha factor homolog n=1 Tax=Drosophila albomicans TaxID=7291 RepID=A0A6P8X2J4_DROAB|nr:lipopolysaccharide-induced tumor necrosis factor-alpha factor homolog [Drosophila albomicans]
MEPVYPKAPLEEPKTVTGQVHEQPQVEQQRLLPPTYDQATAAPAQTSGPGVTATGTAIPAVTTGPSTTQHTVIVVPGSAYGPEPQDVQCPYCHNYTRTRVSYRPNSRTHLIALLLCLFQLWCCVCLPYCISSCMNTNHYCGMCDQYLGTYLRK